MVQRKCGTCRFFQDAVIACSGWCTHPDRGELHDLVLVRRAELACRNSWDQDLWEQTDGVSSPPAPATSVQSKIPNRGVPENPTDRITSISISKVKQVEPSRRKHPAVTGGQQSLGTSDVVAAQKTPGQIDGRSRSVNGSSLGPSFEMALRGGRASNSDQFETAGVEKPEPVVRRSFDRMVEPPKPTYVGMVKPVVEAPSQIADTSPLPVEELSRVLEEGERPQSTAPNGRSGNGFPAVDAPLERVVNIDGPGGDYGESPARELPSSSTSAQAIQPQSPIDSISWIAGVPRCCDTCRDFRRDPEGKEGYCGNRDAQIPQTMVKSHELACRSSFGVWWLPTDETWLERADVSHHTRPTPYLDELLAGLRSSSSS